MNLNDAFYNQLQNTHRIKYSSKLFRKLRPFEHLCNLGRVATKMTQIRPDHPVLGHLVLLALCPKMPVEVFT